MRFPLPDNKAKPAATDWQDVAAGGGDWQDVSAAESPAAPAEKPAVQFKPDESLVSKGLKKFQTWQEDTARQRQEKNLQLATQGKGSPVMAGVSQFAPNVLASTARIARGILPSVNSDVSGLLPPVMAYRGAMEAMTPQQPEEDMPSALERRLLGASAVASGAAGTGALLRPLAAPKLSPTEAAVKALRPRATQTRFAQDFQTAAPELQKAGPIENLADLQMALPATKTRVWQPYLDALQKVGNENAPGVKIADAMRKTIQPADLLRKNPAVDVVNSRADVYQNQNLTMNDLESIRQQTVSDLATLKSKYPTAQRAALRSDPQLRALQAEHDAVTSTMDDIFQQKAGLDAPGVRRLHGALQSIEKAAERRANVAARQVPTGLFPALGKVAGAGKIAGGVLGGGFPMIGQGLAEIGAGKLIGQGNTTDALIRQALSRPRWQLPPGLMVPPAMVGMSQSQQNPPLLPP